MGNLKANKGFCLGGVDNDVAEGEVFDENKLSAGQVVAELESGRCSRVPDAELADETETETEPQPNGKKWKAGRR